MAKAIILALVPTAVLAIGCGSAPGPLLNRTSGTPLHTLPEVACTAASTADGRSIVRYQIRNIGPTTIYVLDGYRMPYQLARDANTLVILQGVNPPEPNVLYELPEIPPARPLPSGAVLAREVALGETLLRNHFDVKLAPTTLLHRTVHVRCEVGWGSTPLDTEHTSLRQLFTWQHITGYGPFDVVLP
jgi:hypothetical protein